MGKEEISLEKIIEIQKSIPEEYKPTEIHPDILIDRKTFQKIANFEKVKVEESEFNEIDYVITFDGWRFKIKIS